ncbi:MAG: class I SAM-dependent methyltransferase [Wenyingzhuangia sp.]|uniref:class I SAM-dependent methyltransferase n=1 Tax=Wenyingzhuangia sp. TaxID=1964193 RepID=UPI00321B7937
MNSEKSKIEQESKRRFKFGKNWKSFLKSLNEDKIVFSKKCLLDFLGETDLKEKSFLDVGSGSGLSSLVAKKAGASVYSFDYDEDSVACTKYLKEKYFKNDLNWAIEQGSALNEKYLKDLGKFDIVYSWGVLHHTGDMYKALDLVEKNVADSGKLYISLYNDQGFISKIWYSIKKAYVNSPYIIKQLILLICYIRLWGPTTVKDFIKIRPFYSWRKYYLQRGMSPHRDVIDWVGGYPFEVSKPEEIIHFFILRNYRLEKLKTCGGGKGCNEFLFIKNS